jgi:hypothetical protein
MAGFHLPSRGRFCPPDDIRVGEDGRVTLANTDANTEKKCPGATSPWIERLVNDSHTHTLHPHSLNGGSASVPRDWGGAGDGTGSDTDIYIDFNQRVNPDEGYDAFRRDGTVARRPATVGDLMDHEGGHSVIFGEGSSQREGTRLTEVKYTDLTGVEQTAPADDVRLIGCSPNPISGSRPTDSTTNDIVRANNIEGGATKPQEINAGVRVRYNK